MPFTPGENEQPSSTATAQTAQRASAQPTAAPIFGNGRGLDERRMFSRNNAGEAVSQFSNTLRKVILAQLGTERAAQVRQQILDRTVEGTQLSSIIISYRGEANTVHHFYLLVERSNETLPAQPYQFGSTSIEIQLTACDVDNIQYMEKVSALVLKEWGSTLEKPLRDIRTGSMVLPIELDPNDEEAIRLVAYHAFAAIEDSVLRTENNYVPFSIAHNIDRNDVLSAKMDFHPMPVKNSVGLPLRSDIAVQLVASTNNNQDVLQSNSRILTSVNGYVDMMYMPPQPVVYGQPPSYRRYNPRFVITQATPMTDAVSYERQLLAILSTFQLNHDLLWAATFKPRFGDAVSSNMRDIGALGLEIPELSGDGGNGKGKRLNVLQEGFNLPGFIQDVMFPNLVYSMDIEESGEMSWLDLIFAAAATGDAGAHAALFEAMNALTSGRFASNYDPTHPIVVDSGSRIHLGYYQDEDGNLKDIRNIDYLYVLNHSGEQSLNAIWDWASSFENRNENEIIRLDRRLRLIHMICPSARVKGYARRVDFVGAALLAFDKSAKEAGLTIRGNMSSGMITQRNRGYDNIAAITTGQGLGSIYSYGGANFGNTARMNDPATRWRR